MSLYEKWHTPKASSGLLNPNVVIDGIEAKMGPRISDNLPAGSEKFEFYHIVGAELYEMYGYKQQYAGVAALYQAPDTQIWAWGWTINQAHEKLLAKMHDANKGIVATVHKKAKTNNGK